MVGAFVGDVCVDTVGMRVSIGLGAIECGLRNVQYAGLVNLPRPRSESAYASRINVPE